MLLCSIIPLSGCSPASMPSWVRTMTGNENYERDANNVVRGAKHAPAFNQKSGGRKMGMGKPAGAPPDMGENPFDYFDLHGNPVTPQATAPSPIAPPAAEMPALAPMEQPKPSLTPLISPPAEEQKPAAMEKSGSWFERAFGLNHSETDKNEAYPELSSVPQPPSEFKNIKADHQKNTEALQQEHKQAEEQRQGVSGEPAQTFPAR